GALRPADFRARAGSWLAPPLGGGWRPSVAATEA
ncbi:dethiobiotin synthase, partial [Streptomyces triticirhizae]